jgi:hypothetical protein
MTWAMVLYSALIGVGAVAAAALLAYLVGLSLPRHHRQSAERVLTLTPFEAWARITDFARYPGWQPWLDRVERLRGKGDTVGVVWRHVERKGEHLDLEVAGWEAERKVLLRTADPSLPFRGTWLLEVEPCLGGCKVSVVEEGEIPGPLMRTMWRLFGPRKSAAERFLEALERS